MAVQWEVLGPALGALGLVGKLILQAGRVLEAIKTDHTEVSRHGDKLVEHGEKLVRHEERLDGHDDRLDRFEGTRIDPVPA